MESALKGYKDKEAEAEAAKLREAGEFDKLLATERGKFTKELNSREKRIRELEERETARVTAERGEKFAGAVAQAAGIEASPRLRALLKLAKDDGLDVAPEDPSKEDIEGVIAKLKQYDPETFIKRTGAAPLPAGKQHPNPTSEAEKVRQYWIEQAKRGPGGLSFERI